ncbi:MAG: ABC transporter substrate-binding protein [Kutzneria sp.]|nr:ABC transporter substrate-binding protein [Kutzneria sp.]
MMKASLRMGALLTAAAALTVSGCANPEGTNSGASGTSGGQQTTTATSGSTCTIDQYGTPKIDLKNAVVGFSQSETEANPFRITETASITDEATKLGVKQLLKRNANSNLNQQNSDIEGMLAQGANLLIVAPLNSDGLGKALDAAKARHVPVLTIDRKLNGVTPCKDYLAFIGSDFVTQGKRAAAQLAKVTGGSGKVAILLGATGNNVTTDRTSGFKDYLNSSAKGLSIVAEQNADFTREKGQSVTEQLLQSHPEITAIYAENDEMALGAVTAITAAGKKPGTDIKIVSVDGTRAAVQDIVSGTLNGDVESNPRFGPLTFSTLQDYLAGKKVPSTITIQDKEYDSGNAAAEVANAY